jgi:hypothetical protein
VPAAPVAAAAPARPDTRVIVGALLAALLLLVLARRD